MIQGYDTFTMQASFPPTGMMSGALAALVTSPTELIKTRLQAKGNTLKGPVDVLRQVAAADGVHALWRGAGPGMVSVLGQCQIV